jgi:hypothetical protein
MTAETRWEVYIAEFEPAAGAKQGGQRGIGYQQRRL